MNRARSLAIDIGTTATMAAVSQAGQPEILSMDGSDGPLPSAVWLDAPGILVTGSSALDQGAEAPERLEPSPKRLLGAGPVLLGDRLVSGTDLVAAILARVDAEARRQFSCSSFSDVRLVHPADWGEVRCSALSAAAGSAGLAGVELISAPIAAALELGRLRVPEGRSVAVYDFGGASFQSAVLRRSRAGFDLLGPPVRRDPLGGEDVDQRIIDHLSTGPAGRHPHWLLLIAPPDPQWRRAAAALRAGVRTAREDLSTSLVTQIDIRALDLQIQLTRNELDELALPVIEETADLLQSAIELAGLEVGDLGALHIVGGMSRMPLVADVLWRRFDIRPELPSRPECASVFGALAGFGQRRLDAATQFRPRLGAMTVTPIWARGGLGYGYLELEGDSAPVRVSDEPARGSGIEALATDGATRLARSRGFTEQEMVSAPVLGHDGGLERRFTVVNKSSVEAWFERYVTLGQRWLTIAAPEQVREVADRLRIDVASGDPSRQFELRIIADLPDEWAATERVTLVRNDSWHQVTSESFPLETITSLDEWASRRSAPYSTSPHFTQSGRKSGHFFGRHPAVVNTFHSNDGSNVTRLWCGVIDGRGYSIIATLPRNERLGLPLLANHMVLR